MNEKERFEIILEHIDEKFDILAEGQNIMVKDIFGIKGEIVGIKGEIVGIKGEIVEIKDRLDKMDDRFDKMDERFDNLEEIFIPTVEATDDNAIKLNNHEVRIFKLEKQLA